MSFQHSSFPLRLLMLLLSPTVLAQQSTSITALNELGPENAAMAQRAGLWDVIETTWTSPASTPTRQNLVAERRMVGSFLEEILEPAPNSTPADIKRIDYLSFNQSRAVGNMCQWILGLRLA
jgi:hypothetical protein